MAQRDKDSERQFGRRYPARARWEEHPTHEGSRGHGSFGAERGYNQGGHGGLGAYERGYMPGSYDWKLDRMEGRRGPGRPPRGYQRSDSRIHEDVCEQLMDGPVDVGDIEVSVKNGEVTLNGTVEERWEKRAIEDIAAHVRGVHDVHNRVRVMASQGRHGKFEDRLPPRDERPRETTEEQRQGQPGGSPEHMGT